MIDRCGMATRIAYEAFRAIRRQWHVSDLRETQNRKLRDLVRYAYHNTVYYREVFDQHQVRPGDINTAEDIKLLPLLTKATLRERFWDLLPRHLPACRVTKTSGSTGIPLVVLSDAWSKVHNSAAVIRTRRALGMPFIGGPILSVLKTRDNPEYREPHWTYLQGIHRTFYLNPYICSPENVRHAIAVSRTLCRPFLVGFTPAIRTLAYRIMDREFPTLSPKIVVTVGETLTLQTRRLLASTFQAPIADTYACNEAGDMAWQCLEVQGYHINADNCLVEIVCDGRDARHGELGDVVVTNLNRRVMPIIRYTNDDTAVASAEVCACGRRLPLIMEIGGRRCHDVCLPNGDSVPWNQLKVLVSHPNVRQYQLIQNEDASVTFRYVPERDCDVTSLGNMLVLRLEAAFHKQVRVTSECVNELSITRGGKSMLLISHYQRRAAMR